MYTLFMAIIDMSLFRRLPQKHYLMGLLISEKNYKQKYFFEQVFIIHDVVKRKVIKSYYRYFFTFAVLNAIGK